MKTFRDSYQNSKLVDLIKYASNSELKNLIKIVLTKSSLDISSSEICILADLKTALGLYDSCTKSVLTKQQKIIIIAHLVNDKSQKDIALKLNITQQGVSAILNSSLNRIKLFVTNGEIKWNPWTQEEKVYLYNNYRKVSIEVLSSTLNRSKSKILSMFYYLKNKGGP